MSTYLRQFFIMTTLLLLLVALINGATDPFSVWHNRCIEGLNCHKTAAGDKIYMTKAYQWRHVNSDIVILGNSRPELGLDPLSPLFQGKQVYNLAIRGAGVDTQVKHLINLIEQQKPERVILSIDFLDFLQNPNSMVTWPPLPSHSSNLPLTLMNQPNPYYFTNNIKSRLATLFSLDTTLASFKTVISQHQNTSYITTEGFNQALGFISIVNNEGTPALFEQKEQELLRRLMNKAFTLKDKNGESSSFKALALLIDTLKSKQIKLDLFISPFHQKYLETLNRTGHFELYLDWKRELVAQLTQLDFFSYATLLDFSGFNRYTTESVPTKRGEFMRWYWEPSHYRAELGEVIIDHLLSEKTEFRLTESNLESLLAKERNMIRMPTNAHANAE